MESESVPNIKKETEDIYSNVLFVADLPNETTNEDLKKIFQDYHFQFASLYNKNNSTWAQVYLEKKEYADKARHELNGYVLKPINCTSETKIKPIRICKYEGKGGNRQTNIKQSLLVKNIDINMTQKEFYNIFLEYGDIVSGKIEYGENGISKGFGYINYYTEESAEEAKKNLNGKSFFGKNIEIVNLIPMKKNRSNTINLFVINIPKDATEEELRNIFEKFGPVSNISIDHNGFAYVSYNNFDSATKCLNEMKTNPISFPGLPSIVVKNVRTKEERESNRNFMNNNFGGNNFSHQNLNVQFNYLYYNEEIKTDLDLDKEIRLFIKVIMLMDYVPKEVLVDLESMSGLVTFGNFKDYNLFFKKYQEFCLERPPLFDCVPYEMPITNNDDQNNYFEQQKNNNNQIFNPQNNNQPFFNQAQNNFRMMNNYMNRRNNNFPNMNMPMPNINMLMNPNNLNNMNNKNNANNNDPNKKKNIHEKEEDEMDEKIESEIMVKNPGVKFDDIIGMKEMKRILYEIIVVPTIRPDLFTGIRKPQRGILLFGPPGTGKTMIAKAIASECNSTFFNISASSLTSKWVGESEKTVKSLFKLAYKKAPSIIFIDEIDSILSKRNESENEATKRLKTEFLIQFDGLGSNTNARLLVIAATNRPMDLDEALLRRLPKRVYCGPLDEEGRFEFIKKVINRVETRLSDRDIQEVARMTNGYSNSDLKELCKEAAFQPVRELTMEQILHIDKFRPLFKKDLVKACSKIRGTLSPKVINELLTWNEQFGGV